MSKLNLPYHYATSGNLNVTTKHLDIDFSKVSLEVIEHSASGIHSITRYPNGIVLEVKVVAGFVEFWSSHRLVLNEQCEIIFDF